MTVAVAEYLGQRTDVSSPVIAPVAAYSRAKCPFMEDLCSKVQEGNRPVCSVRKRNGQLWIVCRHRLCATKKDRPLSTHQVDVLLQLARTVFDVNLAPQNVYVKREEAMAVVARSTYHADYIMVVDSPNMPSQVPRRAVLEIQGGGETSNTGRLTRDVDLWEASSGRSNRMLASPVVGVGTIETNAWRRQQEQFLVKGNIAMQTGGAMVFAVGSTLYDYLLEKLREASLGDLREWSWSLAVVGFAEDTAYPATSGPIRLVIDQERLLFTRYERFVQALTSQGAPAPDLFRGRFNALDGGEVIIP